MWLHYNANDLNNKSIVQKNGDNSFINYLSDIEKCCIKNFFRMHSTKTK